jgi:hypothetical protein
VQGAGAPVDQTHGTGAQIALHLVHRHGLRMGGKYGHLAISFAWGGGLPPLLINNDILDRVFPEKIHVHFCRVYGIFLLRALFWLKARSLR